MRHSNSLKIFSPKFTCLILLAVWTFAFWPSISAACHSYLRSGYDYQGLAILPILFLLIQRNSTNLKRSTFAHNSLGLIFLAILGLSWLLGSLLELEILRQVSIICMVFAIVMTTCGKKVTSILFLPLTCLFLLMPVGQTVSNQLQSAFSWALMQCLMLTKQAVYWEQNIIYVNNHAYDIHTYLSSLRHIMLFLACGACYAMLRTRSTLNAIFITFSHLFMPLLTLLVFMFSYILLNKLFTTLNIVAEHLLVTGWIISAVGLAHAIALGYILGDRSDIIAKNDNIDWRHEFYARSSRAVLPLVMATSIILLLPFANKEIKKHTENSTFVAFSLPTAVADWNSNNQRRTPIVQEGLYKKGKQTVYVKISQEAIIVEKGWKPIKQSARIIKTTTNKISIAETVVQNSKNKYKIYWTLNYVNGHYLNNQAFAKAFAQFYSLRHKQVIASNISLSTDATADLNSARDRLEVFMRDFINQNSKNIHK